MRTSSSTHGLGSWAELKGEREKASHTFPPMIDCTLQTQAKINPPFLKSLPQVFWNNSSSILGVSGTVPLEMPGGNYILSSESG